MKATQQQANRFRVRLQFALDANAYPSCLHERSKRLSRVLQIDSSTSTTLLMGDKLPDYCILFKLCDELKLQPGFFLDDRNPEDVTSGARLVKPLTTGGDMVMRFPSEITDKWPTCSGIQLWYLVARREMFNGVVAGDIIITLTCKHTPPIVDRDARQTSPFRAERIARTP